MAASNDYDSCTRNLRIIFLIIIYYYLLLCHYEVDEKNQNLVLLLFPVPFYDFQHVMMSFFTSNSKRVEYGKRILMFLFTLQQKQVLLAFLPCEGYKIIKSVLCNCQLPISPSPLDRFGHHPILSIKPFVHNIGLNIYEN